MTVTALPQPDRGRELLGLVGSARSAVTESLEIALEGVTERQLEDSITEAAALESQAQAIRLRLAAEAERRAVETSDASTGTDAWLSKLTGDRREQLRGGGTDLDNAIPVCSHHHRAVEDPRYELLRHSPTEWVLKRRRNSPTRSAP